MKNTRSDNMNVLVVIAFVLAITGQALADWSHPHYSFTCRESEGIDIFGIHDNSTVTILKGKCKDKILTKNGEIFNISYGCTNEIKLGNDKEENTAYEVYISVKDPIFDVTTSSNGKVGNTKNSTEEDSLTEAITFGGHNEHRFKITCLNIPIAGVNKTVAHVFQGMPHKLPENHKEVSPVEMHFKAVKDINAPDISEIYIGDEFFMFLKYTGVSHYQVIPKKCTAYAGTVVPVHGQPKIEKQVELWNEERNTTKCKVNEELLASIHKYNNDSKIIAAEMYGFRFEGSEYITIACEVGVFRENPIKKICPSDVRRKRDTRLTRRDVLDTAIHRKNIIGKLRIIDHPSEYGNSASKSGGSFERIMLSWGILILSSRFTVLW